MACCRWCTTSNPAETARRAGPDSPTAAAPGGRGPLLGNLVDSPLRKFSPALLEAAHRSGLQIVSETWSARYDPPWTPWFLRRNEIMIEVQPRTDMGMLKIGEASPGVADRYRTPGLTKLMALDVPITSRATQEDFDRLQSDVTALKDRHTAIRQANAALIPATLERIFHTGAADATAALS